MPVHYADTSALVKYYLPELGSRWMTALVHAERVATAELTVTETASVLARRVREQALSLRQAQQLFQSFQQDRHRFMFVGLSPNLTQEAAALTLTAPASFRLRALDALHLASARLLFDRLRMAGQTPGSFITADRHLLAATAWAGFSTVNPEDYP